MKSKTRIIRIFTLSVLLALSGCNNSAPSDSLNSLSEDPLSSESELPSASSEELTSSITWPIVTFVATSPIDIPSNAKIKLAGSFNAWNPQDEAYALTHVSGRTYTYEKVFTAADVGTTIQYKYVLLYDNQTENMWNYVEGGPMGGEIGNRSVKLDQIGPFEVVDTIRSFKNNMSQTTLTRGSLELVTLTMPQFSDGRTRTIRIHLPDGYLASSTTVRYPVLYMADGQNLFDAYTSFSGEWELDEALGAMMDDGYPGSIIVGIDNGGSQRLNEYSPTWPIKSGSSTGASIVPDGEKFAAFIVETVKPYIDEHYNTLSAKEYTGIGGSSMGGIISFFTSLSYQDTFGHALIFSSSFWLYEDTLLQTFVDAKVTDVNNFPKMYVYHGTNESDSHTYMSGLEALFVNKGIPNDKYTFSLKSGGSHNEASWRTAFPIAYRWLVSDLPNYN